jgi:hypothetical protein
MSAYLVVDRGYATPCWEWQGEKPNSEGYVRISMGSDRREFVHRLMYRLFVGPIPWSKQVDHLCRNRACMNPSHLELVSNAENTQRGRHAKLSADDVRAIRAAEGTCREIGALYGINGAHVSQIKRRKIWANIA